MTQPLQAVSAPVALGRHQAWTLTLCRTQACVLFPGVALPSQITCSGGCRRLLMTSSCMSALARSTTSIRRSWIWRQIVHRRQMSWRRRRGSINSLWRMQEHNWSRSRQSKHGCRARARGSVNCSMRPSETTALRESTRSRRWQLRLARWRLRFDDSWNCGAVLSRVWRPLTARSRNFGRCLRYCIPREHEPRRSPGAWRTQCRRSQSLCITRSSS
mmetsp:Transcript_68706/g.119348  ORF Transcript_68706/g.119348 Transcript_68706/m.119348 type:complete len:216 (+) Transcript_68706:96-743(+)